MLDRLVEIHDEHDDVQRMLATHGEGEFVGDLALSGWIAFATAVVRRNGNFYTDERQQHGHGLVEAATTKALTQQPAHPELAATLPGRRSTRRWITPIVDHRDIATYRSRNLFLARRDRSAPRRPLRVGLCDTRADVGRDGESNLLERAVVDPDRDALRRRVRGPEDQNAVSVAAKDWAGP